MLNVNKQAVADLRYLLAKGYRRTSALRFVADKFAMDKTQRLLLYRCVYSPEMAWAHRDKLVPRDALSNSILSVDGFNVLWTVDAVIKDRPVFLSDDGFVRDISINKGTTSPEGLSNAIELTISALAILLPCKTLFVLDRPVSRSGEISSNLRKLMVSHKLNGSAVTSNWADSEVLKSGEVVATSDSVIIDKAARAFDLAAFVIEKQLRIIPIKI